MSSSSRSVVGSLVVVAAVSVILGFASGSWLAGVLVGVALCLSVVGMAFLLSDSGALGWALLAIGLAIAACSVLFTGMEGRWWWLLPWLLLGILAFSAGATTRDNRRGRGDTLMTIGVLASLFAVLGPWVVYDALAGVRQSGTWLPSGGDVDLAPLSYLAKTVFTSFWGYVTLLALFVIGVTWRGNRGGVVALVLLPVAVVIIGGIDTHAAETASDWLASGPIDQLARILRGSQAQWDTAGWGVLITGAAIAVLAAASLRRILRASSLLALGAGLRERGRDEDPQAFMSRNVDAWPYACSVVVFFFGYFAEPLLMWLALRRVAGGGDLPFPAIGMPDLAAPHFWPVWDLSYFLVALAAAVIAVVVGRLYRRYGVVSKLAVVSNPVWQAAAPFIGALFVPGGVMLLGAAALFTTMIELPLVAAGVKGEMERLELALQPSGWAGLFGLEPESTPAQATGPAADVDSLANLLWLTNAASGPTGDESPRGQDAGVQPEADLGEEPGHALDSTPSPLEDEGSAEPPPIIPSPSSGETRARPGGAVILADAGPGLVDVVVSGDAQDVAVVTLGKDGALVRWRRGIETDRSTVPVGRPLGLATAAADRVFIVDCDGRIADVSLSAQGHEVVHSCAPGLIACFAGHPHGNHVAFGREGEAGIRLFAATTERVDDLVAEPAVPTALAFAHSSRYLAAGDARGVVVRVDGLKRNVEPLADSGVTAAVVRIAPAPGGAWMAAFETGALVGWDERRERVIEGAVNAGITALTIDRDDGRIATGDLTGSVRVWSRNLMTLLFDERLHDGEVCHLEFVDGRLISAGADGCVLAVRV